MKYLINSIITGLLMALSWTSNRFSFLLFIGFLPLLNSIENLKKKN